MLNNKIILKFCIYLISCKFVFGNYNVSLADLVKCQEYRIHTGYAYREFFLIEDIKNDRQEGEVLHLKFYVIAGKDAHILLSNIDNPKRTDDVYEIVIGAGGNTFATIRGNIGSKRLVLKTVNNVLSVLDPTPIIIKLSNDGKLEVVIPGLEDPFMFYEDANPIHVKYVSFSTFGSAPARWFYDCRNDTDSNQIAMETRNLTKSELLKLDLFRKYDPYIIPEGLKNIEFSFKIKGISHDLKQSILKTRIEIKMKWHDPKLKWNPSEYDNLKGFRVFDYISWTPTLMIINGARSVLASFSQILSISNDGSVISYTRDAIFETWCIEGSTNWPFDDLRCNIKLGIHEPGINLIYDNRSPLNNNSLAELSEWNLIDISISDKDIGKISENEKFNSIKTDLILKFHLERNQFFYKRVFHTPLIVSIVMILISFFLTKSKRGSLNLLSSLIIYISFLVLTKHAPLSYVPRLMWYYEGVLLISCFTYILHIFKLWMIEYPPNEIPPNWISTIINFSPLRYILGLKFVDSADYLKIQEQPWNEISRILERIIFVMISIFLIISIVNNY